MKWTSIVLLFGMIILAGVALALDTTTTELTNPSDNSYHISTYILFNSTGKNVPEDILGYWPLEESSGVLVGSIEGRNGSMYSGTGGYQAPGLISYGHRLDETNEFIVLNNTNDALVIYNQSAISFWINYTSIANTPTVVNFRTGDDEVMDIILSSAASNKYDVRIWEQDGGTASISAGDATLVNLWHHVVFTSNASMIGLWVDGSHVGASAFDGSLNNGTGINWSFGGSPIGNDANCTVDEISIWNKALTPTEIGELYNSGSGFNPTSNVNAINTNATLFIWDSSGTIFNQSLNLSSAVTSTAWNVTGFSLTNYKWNVQWCNTYNNCSMSSTNYTFTYGITAPVQASSSVAAETDSQAFNVTFNVTSGVPTASLNWNGTKYAGTGTNVAGNQWRFDRTIQIPVGSGNKNVFWEITSGALQHNTTTTAQNVYNISLELCSQAVNVTFLNFTFRDEADNSVFNASNDLTDFDYWLGDGTVYKTFIFTNSSVNDNYAFCFRPPHETLNVDLTFKYSNTGYPIRTFQYDNQALTNSTTNKILYLLAAADGIYSSIQVLNIYGNPISGVSMTLDKEIGGTWTQIETGVTDSSGTVTFWVNPNFDHRLTAVKSGYQTQTVTIRPSQTIYTLTMETSTGNATYVSGIEGIRWVVLPKIGTLFSGVRNFNATITSSQDVLENCKLEILNATDHTQVFATATSAATNATYCYVGTDYTAVKDVNLFGRLSIDTAATDSYVVVDSDWKWIVWDLSSGDGYRPWNQISSFFSELKDLNEFGTGNERDFSRLIFFFLLATIFVGLFTYFSGYELQNPGVSIFLIVFIILFASAGGFLTFDSGSDNVSSTMEQWGFLLIFIIFSLGYVFNTVRRAAE